jgi:type 1 glutamine amidotransferase
MGGDTVTHGGGAGKRGGSMKALRWAALGALLLLVVLALRVWPELRAARGGREPVVDRVAPALPPELGANGAVAILLFSKTSGFRHADAIPACERSVREIAARRGWQVFATENAAVFDDALLARFRVLVSNNATGDNWTAEPKDAFRRWILAGGGFVGVHGAAGTRYRFWDWYTDELLRARFVGHPLLPQLQPARVVVEDRAHPATRALPEAFVHEDEWYSFERSARGPEVRVLASLDEASYAPRELLRDLAMGDHPIVWSHCPGRGRAFYSALGHAAETYERPEHALLLEGAVAWAAGAEGGCP